jgi:hypothetical protein
MRSFFQAGDSPPDVRPAPLLSEFQNELLALETGEPETFEAVPVPLRAPEPRDIAVLHVHDGPMIEGERRLRFAFHFGGDREESLAAEVLQQRAAAGLSVSEIAARERWQADFDQLRSWWKTMPRLTGWMRRLADASPAPPLLVWDTTAHQTPWELYYDHHPAVEVRSRWLGAELEIVRWATVGDPAEPRAAEQTDSLGDWLLMETADVDTAVDGLLPSPGPAKVTSMKELLVQLRRDDLRFALLMLHGRTEKPEDGTVFRFGGFTLNQLEHRDMRALHQSQAVVLLNGCNTAKFVAIGEQALYGTTSFTSVFLSKGASSVIATLSDVDADHAYDFVHHLLFSGGDDRRLGGLLRKWRRSYVDTVSRFDSANPDHFEEFKAFFQGFTYVCYGHPDSTLRVVGTEGAGA